MGFLDILASIPKAITEKARADEFGVDYRQRWQEAQDKHTQSELQNAISNATLKTKAQDEAARIRAALQGKPEGTDPTEALGSDLARARDLGFRKDEVGISGAEQGQEFAKSGEGRAVEDQRFQAQAAARAEDPNYGELARAKAAMQAQSDHARASLISADRPLAGGTGGTSLTTETLVQAARRYLKTGKVPTLGMGAKGDRQAILNMAAVIDPNADISYNEAQFGSDKASLANVQKSRDTISAFKGMSEANIERLREASRGVVDVGFQPANELLRSGARAFGDPAQSKYDAARQVAINEVARITNTANLMGVLSDTARKEVEAFNPAGATLEQTLQVLDLLSTEVSSRTESLDAEIAIIKKRLGGILAGAPEAGDPAADWLAKHGYPQ